jgi:hypothetical protein
VRQAALQAEVVALRATVLSLRADLDAARVVVPAAPSSLELRWVTLHMPLLRAALQHAELGPAELTATEASAPAATIELDLREATSRTEIALSDLPEAALLDPRRDRDEQLRDQSTPEAEISVEAPVRRIA